MFFEVIESTFALCRQFNQNHKKFSAGEAIQKQTLAKKSSSETAATAAATTAVELTQSAFEMFASSVVK